MGSDPACRPTARIPIDFGINADAQGKAVLYFDAFPQCDLDYIPIPAHPQPPPASARPLTRSQEKTRMTRFRSTLMRVVTVAASVVLIAMMLHTVVSTLSRSLFNRPLFGTYETAEYWYLPLVSLFGLLAAHFAREHIQVTAFTDLLPSGLKASSRILMRVLGALTCFAIGVATLVKGIEDTRVGTTAGLTDIPSWPPLLVVPIAFLLYGVLLLLPEPPEAESPAGDPAEVEGDAHPTLATASAAAHDPASPGLGGTRRGETA